MTTIPLADRETAVYRLFNRERALLYVGISCDPNERLKDHKAQKHWWPDVDHIKITWRRNRADALRAEAWAIASEVPVHNDWRPSPRRFGTFGDDTAGWASPSRLSVGEAAKYLRVPPVELLDLVRMGALPHNRAGPKVWFSKKHIERIEIRMTARAIAAGNAFASTALQGIAQA